VNVWAIFISAKIKGKLLNVLFKFFCKLSLVGKAFPLYFYCILLLYNFVLENISFLLLLFACDDDFHTSTNYEAYSESKYRFAVKKSSKVSYKILLLSDSTFLKLFFHIFTVIIELLILAGHKFLYTLLTVCDRLRC